MCAAMVVGVSRGLRGHVGRGDGQRRVKQDGICKCVCGAAISVRSRGSASVCGDGSRRRVQDPGSLRGTRDDGGQRRVRHDGEGMRTVLTSGNRVHRIVRALRRVTGQAAVARSKIQQTLGASRARAVRGARNAQYAR